MLKLDVTINGDKVVIGGLRNVSQDLPFALQRGLRRNIRGIYAEGFKLLKGGARTQGVKTEGKNEWNATGWGHDKKTKTRPRGQLDLLGARPGSYPVPRVSAHLLQLLDWVDPGETVAADGQAFTAGKFQAILFDSAAYSDYIHEGEGSSKKYGRRPFMEDAVKNFDQGGKILEIMEEEVQKALDKSKE